MVKKVVVTIMVTMMISLVNSSEEVVVEEEMEVSTKNFTSEEVVVVEDNSNKVEISLVKAMSTSLIWVVYLNSSAVKKFGLSYSINPTIKNQFNWRIVLKNWLAHTMEFLQLQQLIALKKMQFVKMNFKHLNILQYKSFNQISV